MPDIHSWSNSICAKLMFQVNDPSFVFHISFSSFLLIYWNLTGRRPTSIAVFFPNPLQLLPLQWKLRAFRFSHCMNFPSTSHPLFTMVRLKRISQTQVHRYSKSNMFKHLFLQIAVSYVHWENENMGKQPKSPTTQVSRERRVESSTVQTAGGTQWIR